MRETILSFPAIELKTVGEIRPEFATAIPSVRFKQPSTAMSIEASSNKLPLSYPRGSSRLGLVEPERPLWRHHSKMTCSRHVVLPRQQRQTMYSHVLLLACSIAWDTDESKLILPRSRGVAGDPIPTPVGRISNCYPWTIVSLFFLLESSSASNRRPSIHQSCVT